MISTADTKFPSIAAWAASLGSKAKTDAGQRKAIFASLRRRPFTQWGQKINSAYWPNTTPRADYYAAKQRTRQERLAEALSAGQPLPATRESVKIAGKTPIPILKLDIGEYNRYAQVGEWYITLSENREYDYHYYAKSYGHPKVTVSDRTVHIRRVLPDGTMEVRDVAVDAWRGNYLLNALITAGVVTRQDGARRMEVRLHPAFHLNVVRQGRSLTIYARSLAGTVVDYCATWHGLTFHAATPAAAVRGLRRKLQSVSAAKNAPINRALGLKLGFCEEGMKQFARDFDLNLRGNYSAQQIAERVLSDLPSASKYARELRTLASAVGYAIPAGL